MFLHAEAGLVTIPGGYAPGHAGSVVGYAQLAVGAEQDDAAVASEAVEEIFDGLLCG